MLWLILVPAAQWMLTAYRKVTVPQITSSMEQQIVTNYV